MQDFRVPPTFGDRKTELATVLPSRERHQEGSLCGRASVATDTTALTALCHVRSRARASGVSSCGNNRAHPIIPA
jgi:hypothetical protein